MLSFFRKAVLSLFLLLICLELILRFGYGFCSAPLYVADPDYEYIYAPNQAVKRFGNVIRTNSLSMRSDEVSSTDSVVVLLIGDSVINGGSLTGNDDLATTKLEAMLSAELQRGVRVLNISAGSWGPDNGAAYLRKHGTFGAKLMCLVASSHDAYDLMTHHDQVGVDPNLPDKQYKVALGELWNRYLYPIYFKNIRFNTIYYAPRVTEGKQEDEATGIQKDGAYFNPGFQQLRHIADANKIPFFIYLHPETSEVKAGDYNEQGQAIIAFARKDSIRLVKELDFSPRLEYYRKKDVVHYNRDGQLFLADCLFPLFLEYLTQTE